MPYAHGDVRAREVRAAQCERSAGGERARVRRLEGRERGERRLDVRGGLDARIVLTSATEHRERGDHRALAVYEHDRDFVCGGDSELRLEGHPELRHLFEVERQMRDANALDLRVQVAVGERPRRGVANLFAAEQWMVVKDAHHLAEQTMTERVVVALHVRGDEVLKAQRQRGLAVLT